VTEVVKVELDVPVLALMALGEREMLKSCAGLIVSVSPVVFVRDPAAPVAVIV
jgi:hypothetical protein